MRSISEKDRLGFDSKNARPAISATRATMSAALRSGSAPRGLDRGNDLPDIWPRDQAGSTSGGSITEDDERVLLHPQRLLNQPIAGAGERHAGMGSDEGFQSRQDSVFERNRRGCSRSCIVGGCSSMATTTSAELPAATGIGLPGSTWWISHRGRRVGRSKPKHRGDLVRVGRIVPHLADCVLQRLAGEEAAACGQDGPQSADVRAPPELRSKAAAAHPRQGPR